MLLLQLLLQLIVQTEDIVEAPDRRANVLADILLRELPVSGCRRLQTSPVVQRVECLMSHFLQKLQRANTLLIITVAEHDHSGDALADLYHNLEIKKRSVESAAKVVKPA